ncbi:MAG TPA: sodium:solute symporter [Saprospiraceae bacterium]|nr:sodium:solute symporter [Saprospiraceae bacterium]
MNTLDWYVLGGTLSFIVIYGLYVTRKTKGLHGYFLGGTEAKWWTVGLSVMATQASAITFLSTPGQAFHSGMGFVQFYFGLPIAMVVICITFIPIYKRLNVYTAYEYLEQRFDLKTRSLAAFIFLIQRGLGAGITIYAPSIILSTIIGWNLNATILVIGTLVIIYTVSGGTKAVSVTQKQQMFVMMGGMFAAFFIILSLLPENVSFANALQLAGTGEKMEILNFSFDPEVRYTVWTGIIGGFFIQLAYFGTDQSQVQRYLSGKSVKESQWGMIFNGLLKVPMQFFILLVGVMVFVFYQFSPSPVFFNQAVVQKVYESEMGDEFRSVEEEYALLVERKNQNSVMYTEALNSGDKISKEIYRSNINKIHAEEKVLKERATSIIASVDSKLETNDKDYVFIHFILHHLPVGLVGLLLAVIFSAAMSSTASELNALGSTTTIDIFKRNFKPIGDDKKDVLYSRMFTLMWGIIAILFATFGTLAENLIQLVNIVGSIFYGSVLGIFITAFYLKHIHSHAVFIAALLAQSLVILVFIIDWVSYLWLNVIGCISVMILGFVFQTLIKKLGK